MVYKTQLEVSSLYTLSEPALYCFLKMNIHLIKIRDFLKIYNKQFMLAKLLFSVNIKKYQKLNTLI